MIAIVTPVWNSFETVQRCCDFIDKNTKDQFIHILVDDNSDSIPPIRVTKNRFILSLRNDYDVHHAHIGKSIQIGYRFAKDFINFNYFFICESDLEVPKDWDSELITSLNRHPEAGVIDVLPVNRDGIASYPSNVNVAIGINDELDEIVYADLNACVFNPKLFNDTWGFGDFVSHHDILLSKVWGEMGFKFYRNREIKAYHEGSGTRKHLLDLPYKNYFERDAKYG